MLSTHHWMDLETPVLLNTKVFLCLWLCKNTNKKNNTKIATIKQRTWQRLLESTVRIVRNHKISLYSGTNVLLLCTLNLFRNFTASLSVKNYCTSPITCWYLLFQRSHKPPNNIFVLGGTVFNIILTQSSCQIALLTLSLVDLALTCTNLLIEIMLFSLTETSLKKTANKYGCLQNGLSNTVAETLQR